MKQSTSPTDSSKTHLHCASEECDAHYPTALYNINFNEQLVGDLTRPQWVCAKHLPRHLTFPVGLHNDEYKEWKNEPQNSQTLAR